MTYEEKIEFLKGYKRSESNVVTYMAQIKALEETMLPQGYHISDMPKRGGSDDPMADFGAEFYEIDKRLKRAEARMLKVVAVINQIADTDDLGHSILTYKYINGMSAKEIEIELGIAGDTRWKHHRKAVERLKI